MALVNPAKGNPEVIVYAVAARDKKRAEAFAKKHGIPHVKDSYDGQSLFGPRTAQDTSAHLIRQPCSTTQPLTRSITRFPTVYTSSGRSRP